MGLVDVIVGMQWGSEGKGKIAAYLSRSYEAMVRSGGPQAGHTFYHDGRRFINRQIPCGVFSRCSLYISAAGIINPEVLRDEISRYHILPGRLMIDYNAMILTSDHIESERQGGLKERLGSTCEGVGAASADKIMRTGRLFREYARDDGLEEYAGDTVKSIHAHLAKEEKVLIEGTQGFGLSLNHGSYPFVTSRDVTAAALLSDAGVSPKDHGRTIGVMRTYPIRVGGNSGPTGSSEISWAEIEKRADSKESLIEYTTVTGRVRRVFEQDFTILHRAIMVNRPDELALMFLDHINTRDRGKRRFEELSNESRDYVNSMEDQLQTPVTLIGTGPGENEIIDRRVMM